MSSLACPARVLTDPLGAGGRLAAGSPTALAVYLQDAWGNLASSGPSDLAVRFAAVGGDTLAAAVTQVGPFSIARMPCAGAACGPLARLVRTSHQQQLCQHGPPVCARSFWPAFGCLSCWMSSSLRPQKPQSLDSAPWHAHRGCMLTRT